ncbi:(2Fe-2S)-binding protein [Marinomonas transparens]|uniref:(2Fe-2S)-binding protein n=1 Tax=Marinomonas transparens TaxID=2795388 RepID=A0A934MZK9_9GAMM|nr:(2Fe-2S)-binding protein [Marinomonas transparens]MBJ7537655.1 (2Fe-2S)-binding protein [Marinomonas transparens]
MFTKVTSGEVQTITIQFEGETLVVRKGLNVAAALLEAGVKQFRETPVSGQARTPFCMMGVCFDCLLIIDGMHNQQSCMIEVAEGMKIERQLGMATIEFNASAEQGL